jgi:hypothetical protein
MNAEEISPEGMAESQGMYLKWSAACVEDQPQPVK